MADDPSEVTPPSLYERIGGHATFDQLVSAFYRGVAHDPVLAPMYDPEDLAGARERLSTFLAQYWGGPRTYSANRGHPRLRLRHAPFHINPQARDRWLVHMRCALDEVALSPADDAELWDYLERAAHSLVNTFAPTPTSDADNAN